jgi:hypothetical protein
MFCVRALTTAVYTSRSTLESLFVQLSAPTWIHTIAHATTAVTTAEVPQCPDYGFLQFFSFAVSLCWCAGTFTHHPQPLVLPAALPLPMLQHHPCLRRPHHPAQHSAWRACAATFPAPAHTQTGRHVLRWHPLLHVRSPEHRNAAQAGGLLTHTCRALSVAVAGQAAPVAAPCSGAPALCIPYVCMTCRWEVGYST